MVDILVNNPLCLTFVSSLPQGCPSSALFPSLNREDMPSAIFGNKQTMIGRLKSKISNSLSRKKGNSASGSANHKEVEDNEAKQHIIASSSTTITQAFHKDNDTSSMITLTGSAQNDNQGSSSSRVRSDSTGCRSANVITLEDHINGDKLLSAFQDLSDIEQVDDRHDDRDRDSLEVEHHESDNESGRENDDSDYYNNKGGREEDEAEADQNEYYKQNMLDDAKDEDENDAMTFEKRCTMMSSANEGNGHGNDEKYDDSTSPMTTDAHEIYPQEDSDGKDKNDHGMEIGMANNNNNNDDNNNHDSVRVHAQLTHKHDLSSASPVKAPASSSSISAPTNISNHEYERHENATQDAPSRLPSPRRQRQPQRNSRTLSSPSDRQIVDDDDDDTTTTSSSRIFRRKKSFVLEDAPLLVASSMNSPDDDIKGPIRPYSSLHDDDVDHHDAVPASADISPALSNDADDNVPFDASAAITAVFGNRVARLL